MPKTHAFRLKTGQDLQLEIEAYIKKHNIQAGCIMTVVGSLTQYHIRFANQPEGTKGSGYFEIVSFTGTASTNGSHLHISISDANGHTIGGHMLEGNIIYTTAEVLLLESKHLSFDREHDPATGSRELVVKAR
jgi:hypothetical protein